MDKNGYFPLVLVVVLFLFSVTAADAVDKRRDGDKRLAAQYSMVGLRLGIWADFSEDEPSRDPSVDADLPDAGFHTEIYLDYRLMRPLFLEASFGIAGRGDAVITDADDRYIGTINLYPVLLQLKLSPLSGRSPSFLPYLLGGGGFVWGRQSIDIVESSDIYYNPEIANRTEYDFIGVIGGGVDIALSEQLGLNINVKYHPIRFGDTLAGVKDHTGMAFSVGMAYFLHKN